jgi:hypothetical protein
VTKRKKQTYACVAGVVALALLLDRLVGPSGAGAAPIVVGAGAPPRRTVAAPTGGPARGAAIVLAPARFPRALPPDAGEARDLFGLTEEIQQTLAPVAPPAKGHADPRAEPGAGADHSVAEPAAFAAAHRVAAVVAGGRSALALVDGTWLRVGQKLDGYELVRIRGTTAIFRSGAGQAELSVDTDPPLSGGGAPAAADQLKSPGAAVDKPLD